MLIKETVEIERELHFAPCLKCGGGDIVLSDSNYSSFNFGGGRCRNCGHEISKPVGTLPSKDALAAVWNAENDIPSLIAAEEKTIASAQARIEALKAVQHGSNGNG